MEPMEALRYLPYLKKGGWIITSSTPFVNIPNYPDMAVRDLEYEAEKKVLLKAVNGLSGREQTIVRMRFGLGTSDGEERTQKEVADSLGISQSYISRLEKKIMIRLRREIVKYS